MLPGPGRDFTREKARDMPPSGLQTTTCHHSLSVTILFVAVNRVGRISFSQDHSQLPPRPPPLLRPPPCRGAGGRPYPEPRLHGSCRLHFLAARKSRIDPRHCYLSITVNLSARHLAADVCVIITTRLAERRGRRRIKSAACRPHASRLRGRLRHLSRRRRGQDRRSSPSLAEERWRR